MPETTGHVFFYAYIAADLHSFARSIDASTSSMHTQKFVLPPHMIQTVWSYFSIVSAHPCHFPTPANLDGAL
jgi:hypothetical protein